MKQFKRLAILALFAFLAVFPLVFSNPAITTIAVFTLLFAAAATGWNIFSGYTGYISIGHAAFYGLGAYFFALLCQVWNVKAGWPPFLLLPLVGLLTGLCAVPIGWVALKTRRYRFLVLTIAVFALCSQVPELLGKTPLGGAEVSLPIPLWSGDVFNLPFYYTTLILVVLAVTLSWSIRRSKFGLALLAIRDDEDRARSLAVHTELYKLIAFVISTIIVGMVGAIAAYFLEFVSPPSAFDPSFNIFMPLLAFLGGLGTLVGPLLGAIIAVPLQQYITLQFGAQDWDLILYGVCFLFIILFLPEGLLPTIQSRWPRWAKSLSALSYRHGWAVSLRQSGTLVLAVIGLIRAKQAVHRTNMQEEKSIIPVQIIRTEPVTFAPFDFMQGINEDWFSETPYQIPGEQLFQQFLTSGPLSHSTTQKLKPVRLIEISQEAIVPSPVPGASESGLLAPSLQAETRIRAVEVSSQASHSVLNLGSYSSRPLAARCPRCGSSLRLIQTMVFCRRCGLIVSGKQE